MALAVLAEDGSQHLRDCDDGESPPDGGQRPEDLGGEDLSQYALEGHADAGVAVGRRDLVELTVQLKGQLSAVIDLDLANVRQVSLVGHQDGGQARAELLHLLKAQAGLFEAPPVLDAVDNDEGIGPAHFVFGELVLLISRCVQDLQF